MLVFRSQYTFYQLFLINGFRLFSAEKISVGSRVC